jgi:hypothetical protein
MAQAVAETSAQNKALAKRAAELDAYRKLAEAVRGFRITSQTTVRDFVTENDEIATGLDTYLRGVRFKGPARYYEDGTCEVDAEITLRQLVGTLKSLHSRHYRGNQIRATDFDQMITRSQRKVIKVTGSGAPRPLASDIGPDEGFGQPAPARRVIRLPAIWRQYPHNVRLMDGRAAEIYEFRILAELFWCFSINSSTTFRYFVTENDEINTSLDTFLRGVRSKPARYNEDGTVEVEVEVTLRQVVATLKSLHSRHYRGNRVRAVDFDQMVTRSNKKVISEVGMGAPRDRRRRPAEAIVEERTEVEVRGPATIDEGAGGAEEGIIVEEVDIE